MKVRGFDGIVFKNKDHLEKRNISETNEYEKSE